jgi:hypothetical protein
MRADMPETLVPWYADDSGAVDTARGLKFLQEEGPKYGYHPEPAKCIYVCKAKDEACAQHLHMHIFICINSISIITFII